VGERPIEIVYADDQNKPDVGTAIAGRWMSEQNVSAIVCASASSITLAVSDMVAERNKVLLVAGSLSADLTGKRCHPTTFQFGLDTYAGPVSVIGPSVKAGAKTWFIINVDYAFGQSLREEGTKLIAASGAKLLGATSFPLGTSDFAKSCRPGPPARRPLRSPVAVQTGRTWSSNCMSSASHRAARAW